MAQAGEIEVFRNIPEEGKCYEHVEATRSEYNRGQPRRVYFTTNQPVYVGKFIRQERDGYGDHASSSAFFMNNGEEIEVPYSWEGRTCFMEVPCKLNLNSKAKNQAVRNVYENKTGQSAKPGNGPANLIRSYAGIKVPKGANGGYKKTRKAKRSKKTRRNRK
jgi:hypothetical protein